jgi:hypothetical protein
VRKPLETWIEVCKNGESDKLRIFISTNELPEDAEELAGEHFLFSRGKETQENQIMELSLI